MKIVITPMFINLFHQYRLAILQDIDESYMLNQLANIHRVSEPKNTRLVKKLIRDGKDKALDYCRAKKPWTIHPRKAKQVEVDQSPFLHVYQVEDYKTRDLVNVGSLTAFRCFRALKGKNRIIHNVKLEDYSIWIDGVELVIRCRLDALQGLKAHKIETTSIEPSFFSCFDNAEWKIYGLLLPELHATVLNIFYFAPGKRFDMPCEHFAFSFFYNSTVRKQAIEVLEDFVYWIKKREGSIEKRRTKTRWATEYLENNKD